MRTFLKVHIPIPCSATQKLCEERQDDTTETSDDDGEDGSCSDSENEGDRLDELELSFVDLSPQFASFFSI